MNKSKILTLFLFSTLCFSFASCEKDDDNNSTRQEEIQDANKPDSTNVPTDTTGSNKTIDAVETAIQGVTVTGKVGYYTYVDLGLPSGAKWATYNVGASKPTEYGDYIAWGETTPKEYYLWENYKYEAESYKKSLSGSLVATNLSVKDGWKGCNKYTVADGRNEYVDSVAWYDNKGNFIGDNLTTLLVEDDAATANWGSDWRMPTITEQQELIDGCKWEWTEDFNGSGVAGRVGTSKTNGNTIFMPAAGDRFYTIFYSLNKSGCYWSSSLDESNSFNANALVFESDSISLVYTDRCNGKSVRAVVK